MGHKKTWALVCDASRARLYARDADSDGYDVVREFEHPDSRAHARDLMADVNGRKPVGPSRGATAQTIGYGRPGAAPTTDPTEVEAQKFARELTEALERGRLDHAYDGLIIAAPPHFLGLLKGLMGDPLKRHVELTIDKDFTKLDVRDVASRIATASPST